VGWVGLGQSADGLGWVTRNGPMDNSAINVTCELLRVHFYFFSYNLRSAMLYGFTVSVSALKFFLVGVHHFSV